MASRKLRQYFQANPILVMMDQPIKKSMNKPEVAGRMVQWAIELSQFDIEYHPRTAIKAQALADFIAEFTLLDEDRITDEVDRWTIQTDSLSAQKKGGSRGRHNHPRRRSAEIWGPTKIPGHQQRS